MTAPTGVFRGLSCLHCAATINRDETAARVLGWRVWEGVTLGGQQKRDVVCPTCAGTAEPVAEAGPSWDVECTTCEWSFSDGGPIDPGEEIPDAKTAETVGYEHRCEKQLRYKSPAGKWYDENDREFRELAYPPKVKP